MTESEVRKTLEECGAIFNGHVVFTKKEIPPGSGNWFYFHGDSYVSKEMLYLRPAHMQMLAEEIARRLIGKKIDIIVGPALGAIGLAPMVANALTAIQHESLVPTFGVASCFAEKVGEEAMAIKRIFANYIKQVPGINIWITEDIGNSGSSARKTVRAARELGANVVGVSFLATRHVLTPDDMDGVPVDWLAQFEVEMWPEDECPLCEKHGFRSVSRFFGKGENFLKRKGLL